MWWEQFESVRKHLSVDLQELADLLKTQKADAETLERKTATIIPAVFHRKGKRIARFEGVAAGS